MLSEADKFNCRSLIHREANNSLEALTSLQFHDPGVDSRLVTNLYICSLSSGRIVTPDPNYIQKIEYFSQTGHSQVIGHASDGTDCFFFVSSDDERVVLHFCGRKMKLSN